MPTKESSDTVISDIESEVSDSVSTDENSESLKNIRDRMFSIQQIVCFDGRTEPPFGEGYGVLHETDRFLSTDYASRLQGKPFTYLHLEELYRDLDLVEEEIRAWFLIRYRPYLYLVPKDISENEKQSLMARGAVLFCNNGGCPNSLSCTVYTKEKTEKYNNGWQSRLHLLFNYYSEAIKEAPVPFYSSELDYIWEREVAEPQSVGIFGEIRLMDCLLIDICAFKEEFKGELAHPHLDFKDETALHCYLQEDDNTPLSPQSIKGIAKYFSSLDESSPIKRELIAASRNCVANKNYSAYFDVELPMNRSLVLTACNHNSYYPIKSYINNPNFLIKHRISSTYSAEINLGTQAEFQVVFCEYIDGKGFSPNYVKTEEDLLNRFILPCFKLIKTLHERGLSHGDLHSSNIAFSDRFQKEFFVDVKRLTDVTEKNSSKLDYRKQVLEDLSELCSILIYHAPGKFSKHPYITYLENKFIEIDRADEYEEEYTPEIESKMEENATIVQKKYYSSSSNDFSDIALLARNEGTTIKSLIQDFFTTFNLSMADYGFSSQMVDRRITSGNNPHRFHACNNSRNIGEKRSISSEATIGKPK